MRIKTETCSNCGRKKQVDIGKCRFCHELPLPVRYTKGQCPLCGNTEQNKHGYCSYCSWKGTTGPGAQLRELIAKV